MGGGGGETRRHPFPLQPKGKLRPGKAIGLTGIAQLRNKTRTQDALFPRVVVWDLSPSLRTAQPFEFSPLMS